MTTTTPSPGSKRAIMAGCTCCSDANFNGQGETIATGRRFHIRLYCPVHSDFRPIPAD